MLLRFVRSRFGAVSDLPDSELPDSDLPDNGSHDPKLGSPALLKGGPKRKVSATAIPPRFGLGIYLLKVVDSQTRLRLRYTDVGSILGTLDRLCTSGRLKAS